MAVLDFIGHVEAGNTTAQMILMRPSSGDEWRITYIQVGGENSPLYWQCSTSNDEMRFAGTGSNATTFGRSILCNWQGENCFFVDNSNYFGVNHEAPTFNSVAEAFYFIGYKTKE